MTKTVKEVKTENEFYREGYRDGYADGVESAREEARKFFEMMQTGGFEVPGAPPMPTR
jgi:flagellar biosynthesis/type III secretory pathway protein FliH